ncbi:MAG: NAD(P)-dependent oxidoreductase [Caldilineales bacterium]
MTTVLITGAGGFIARHLAQTLADAGVRVLGVSHSGAAAPAYNRVFEAGLGETLLPALAAEPIDAVVHSALAAGMDGYRLNLEGTTRWMDEARAAGVGLQIFLSTLSAEPNALSDYGRAKWTLQQRFVDAGEVVFRLGVVIGDGGMYGRIRSSATRAPVVPMLDGGRQLLYVAGIDAVCAVLQDTILAGGESLRGGAWNLIQPEPVTLRDMATAINRQTRRRALLLPVPAGPVLAGLRVAESVPLLRLPITSTNVRGLMQQGQRRFPSDYERFGYPVQRLEELITAAGV